MSVVKNYELADDEDIDDFGDAKMILKVVKVMIQTLKMMMTLTKKMISITLVTKKQMMKKILNKMVNLNQMIIQKRRKKR